MHLCNVTYTFSSHLAACGWDCALIGKIVSYGQDTFLSIASDRQILQTARLQNLT